MARLVAAGPKLILLDDPAGEEIRTVADGFIQSLKKGDAAAMHAALASADVSQRDFVDACLRYIDEATKLRDASQETFGADVIASNAMTERLDAEMFPSKEFGLVIVHDEYAVTTSSGVLGISCRMRRIDGKWTVVAISDGQPKAQLQLLSRCAELFGDSREAIKSGSVRSALAAVDRLEGPLSEALQVYAVSVFDQHPDPPPAVHGYAPPSAERFRQMLGKSVRDEAIQEWFTTLVGLPRVSDLTRGLLISSYESGVGVSVDDNEGVTRIDLRLQPGDGFGRYAGELSHGVSRDDRRADIERKLGSPSGSSGGGDASEYVAYYDHLGLQISYATRDARAADAVVSVVSITKPDASAAPIVADAHLEFRLVLIEAPVDEPTVEFLENPETRLEVAVKREVLLDERAIASVHLLFDDPPGIRLALTPQGGDVLRQATRDNIGKRLAIVLDGRILICPTIQSEIGDEVVISLGGNGTIQDIRHVIMKMHAVVNRLSVKG